MTGYCKVHVVDARECPACEYSRGRADERASVIRYLRVWADSNRDNEATNGRLQALVTDTHADNIERDEHNKRPAEDTARLGAHDARKGVSK